MAKEFNVSYHTLSKLTDAESEQVTTILNVANDLMYIAELYETGKPEDVFKKLPLVINHNLDVYNHHSINI